MSREFRVICCGSRFFNNETFVRQVLSCLHPTEIAHGACQGADTLADKAAETLGIPCQRFPAQWDRWPRTAGPIRNKQMLREFKPDAVVAFIHHRNMTRGTSDMVERAKKAGVKVYVYSDS